MYVHGQMFHSCDSNIPMRVLVLGLSVHAFYQYFQVKYYTSSVHEHYPYYLVTSKPLAYG